MATNALDLDECATGPCGDHATCSTPDFNSFLCTCEPGFEDNNPGDPVNDCTGKGGCILGAEMECMEKRV